MLRAHSIGPVMVSLIEQAGIKSLGEVRDLDADDLGLQIHVETGRKLNSMGIAALANLIELANASK